MPARRGGNDAALPKAGKRCRRCRNRRTIFTATRYELVQDLPALERWIAAATKSGRRRRSRS